MVLYMARPTSGGEDNYGTVFELRPPPTFCRSILCYWNETVLYTFTGNPDGANPHYVNLAFDQAGNIYGTTSGGGMYGEGTTFELTPSGGGYTESILHNFGSGTDGYAARGGCGPRYRRKCVRNHRSRRNRRELRNGLPAHAFQRRVGGECPG